MGIMPVDREQKWQRIIRRFGLPGDMSEKESGNKDQERRQQDVGKKTQERVRPARPR